MSSLLAGELGKAGAPGMCWGTSALFSGDRLSPASGRSFCAEQLRAALTDAPGREELIFDATVIVSELLTNSVRAGSRVTRLSLSLHREVLRLMVDDDAPGRPALRTSEENDVTGRGMAIVAALAAAWSIEPRIPGKQVWADLDVDPDLTIDLPSCNRPTRFELEVPPGKIDEISSLTPINLSPTPDASTATTVGLDQPES